MDDYHELKHTHYVEIKKWQLYWSFDYVSITRRISGVSTIHSGNLVSEKGTTNGKGATKSDVIGPLTST
jgi:hypothetical protein